jgi:hypothetical protein
MSNITTLAPAQGSLAAGPRQHPARHDLLRVGRISIHFFVVAVAFFALGVVTMPFVVADVAAFFYQMMPLALVHTFTLGWITAAMMGVMYRYVPALTRRPVPYPRIAYVQLGLYVIGVSGMVAHFAIGIWSAVWLAAIVVVASVLIFAAEMIPSLWPRLGRRIAETGMFLGVCFLVLAGAIGLILGLDRTYNFLGGSVLTNLAGHVDFAAFGWVTLTICAISYRMLPAFLLAEMKPPPAALWQLYSMAAGILGLGVTLMFALPGAMFWSLAIAASLLAYIGIVVRMIWAGRLPRGWTSRHAVCGILWLVIAIALGLALAVSGAGSVAGNRIASAYGVAGLLGWASNFIIAMSYQLFPGFVARARLIRGFPVVRAAELSTSKHRPVIFVAYNLGVAMIAGGLIAGSIALAIAGAASVGAAGIVYCAMTLWTLSFAYRWTRPLKSRSRKPGFLASL